MRHQLIGRVPGARTLLAIASVAALCVGGAVSPSVSDARVDPMTLQAAGALSANTVAIATGGGTIYLDVAHTQIGSFGINGKRPPGFTQDGTGVAQGRIEFDAHANIPGRHVNVSVSYMLIELSTTPTPNGTGGRAQLIGDCTQPQTDCSGGPAGTQSVLVDVTDASDSGAGQDTFSISYCASTAQQTVTAPACAGAFSGTLRTGNIQVRANVSGSSGNALTAARAPLRLP